MDHLGLPNELDQLYETGLTDDAERQFGVIHRGRGGRCNHRYRHRTLCQALRQQHDIRFDASYHGRESVAVDYDVQSCALRGFRRTAVSNASTRASIFSRGDQVSILFRAPAAICCSSWGFESTSRRTDAKASTSPQG